MAVRADLILRALEVFALLVVATALLFTLAAARQAVELPEAPTVILLQARQEAAEEPRAVCVPASAWRWLRLEATAYTSGPESTGKAPDHPLYGITSSGLPVRPGVVAVDPRLIPLGSVVYVEGYGIAIALDTGSAIRGHRIDVWFADLGDALAWGRRKVWVGVLDAHEAARLTGFAVAEGQVR